MRNLSKKAKTIIAGAAIAGLASAGGAYAYWTSIGSDDGVATTSSSSAAITVHQISVPTNMAPGHAPGKIGFTVQNTGTSSAYVGQVTITIASVTPGPIVVPTHTCVATDYVLTQPAATNLDVAAGVTTALNDSATLGFDNSPSVNQDNCQGAIVNLHYASN